MTTAEEDEPVDTTQLRHRESVLVEAGIFETEDTGRTVSGVVSEPVSVEVIDNEIKENIQEVEQEVAPTKVGEGESSKDAVPTASATSSDIEKALPPPDPPADSVSIGSTAIPPAPRAVRQVSTPGAVMVSRRNNDQGPSTDATAGRRLAADDEHLVQAELIPENGNIEYAVASKPEKEGRAGYVGAGLLLIVVIILAVVIALRGRDIDGSVGEAGISYTESLYLGPSIIGTAAFLMALGILLLLVMMGPSWLLERRGMEMLVMTQVWSEFILSSIILQKNLLSTVLIRHLRVWFGDSLGMLFLAKMQVISLLILV